MRNLYLAAVNAQGGYTSAAEKMEVGKVVEPAIQVDGMVTSFSPLEAISRKPWSSGLGNESLKIKRTELSQKITFALIPALVLISKSSRTTGLLSSIRVLADIQIFQGDHPGLRSSGSYQEMGLDIFACRCLSSS